MERSESCTKREPEDGNIANLQNSRQVIKPAVLAGLQLPAKFPSGHHLQWSVHTSPLSASPPFLLQVAESFPFFLHPPPEVRQYSSHRHYCFQWLVTKCLYCFPFISETSLLWAVAVLSGSVVLECLIIFSCPLFTSALDLFRNT